MAETVLQLGEDHRVLALFTPAVSTGSQTGLAGMGCILVNAGVIHRVGPHRINVKLARSLALQGVSSVRLDLSGRGDTPAAKTQATLAEQAVLDIQCAMDKLTQLYGCQRFVMFGICSGAVNAMDAALADPRLVGVSLLDGYAFATWKTHVLRYTRALAKAPVSQLPGRIVHLLQKLRTPEPSAASTGKMGNRGLGFIEPGRYQHILETLAAQGTRVQVLFSGSIGGHYNHDRQFDDVFGRARFLGRVQCQYLPHIDHTLTTLAAQDELTHCLLEWMHAVNAELGQPQVAAELRDVA